MRDGYYKLPQNKECSDPKCDGIATLVPVDGEMGDGRRMAYVCDKCGKITEIESAIPSKKLIKNNGINY